MEWEKTFANHTTDKGLNSNCMRNLYNSIAKKQKIQLEMGK